MPSEDGEGGLHIVWHVPKVEKGERLEVSFDIKGSGEVDAEALNRFHGVHFGDEIESDELPEVVAETEEEAAVDVEESGAEEAADDSEAPEPPAPKMKFREDMLLRVMADYDHDDNGYLKKAELEDAAKGWNAAHGEAEDEGETESEAPAEDPSPETTDAAEEKACPICGTMNVADAANCMACDYDFTQ